MPKARRSKIPIPVQMETHIKAREDDFVAKGHLTKHLTGGTYEIIRQRTRISSWEEKDYLSWEEILANDLGMELSKSISEIDMGLNMSKDGLSRTEDVDAIYGFRDEYGDGRKASGLRRGREEIQQRRRGDRSH